MGRSSLHILQTQQATDVCSNGLNDVVIIGDWLRGYTGKVSESVGGSFLSS